MAKQITVRGVSEELSRKLQQLSRARGESLNATVLHILEQVTGTDARRRRLARYATWTRDDLREFEEALAAQRTIDEGLWR
jgi:hypothetical protein